QTPTLFPYTTLFRSVKQYRKPLEKTILEIPAGRLEEGEEPEKTAIRELEEETGYTTDQASFITSFYTSPGFANELMYVYFSNKLLVATNPSLGDEHGQIETVELSIEEAVQYVQEGKIQDAKTNYAVLYMQMLERMNQC